MGRTALEAQIEELRNAIVGLRSHLDETLKRVEGFDTLVNQTAEQAQEVASTLGGGRRAGLVPGGLFGLLAIGLAALAIFSPQTLSRWYNDARRFVEEQSRQMGTTGREPFRQTPPRA